MKHAALGSTDALAGRDRLWCAVDSSHSAIVFEENNDRDGRTRVPIEGVHSAGVAWHLVSDDARWGRLMRRCGKVQHIAHVDRASHQLARFLLASPVRAPVRQLRGCSEIRQLHGGSPVMLAKLNKIYFIFILRSRKS
jgi:hypothetical protein